MARVEPQPDVDLSADSVCLVGLGGAVGWCRRSPRPAATSLRRRAPAVVARPPLSPMARWRPTIVAGRRAAAPGRARSRPAGNALRSCTRCSSATVVDPRSRRPEARRCAGTRRAPLRSAAEDAVDAAVSKPRARGAAGARPRRHRAASGAPPQVRSPSERPASTSVFQVCARRRRRPSAHGGAGTPRPRPGRCP